MNYHFLIGGQKYAGALEGRDEKYTVSIREKKYEVQAKFIDQNTLSLVIGNKNCLLHLARDEKKKMFLALGSKIFEVEEIKEESTRSAIDPAIANMIAAPMPGLVVKVNVGEGEVVEKSQILVIIEAMKMENQMRSPMAAKVKKVVVKAGDRVDANQLLIELEPT